MELGRVGVWSSGLRGTDQAQASAAAAELEALGYGALWFPHAGERWAEIATGLLSATDRVVVATGIVSIWSQPADEVATAVAGIEARAPGRFLLGLGVSHESFVDAHGPGTYQQPLATMARYLDGLGEIPAARMILAALGPKMLELAAARTAGTHPYLVTLAQIAAIRVALGPGPMVATELGVVVEADPARARELARAHLRLYLTLPNYVNNWRRGGFTDEDFAAGGSDRLVDALVAWGGPEAIAQRVEDYLIAGADHVCLQVLTGNERVVLPVSQWRELAFINRTPPGNLSAVGSGPDPMGL